eukprot:TRINITY_DN1900_c0_g1_i1.p1 TRINITY_DN1900_c0_g1~~TRINITY_DN1900_c0_g1_i1.p1  ORF type:complete len:155 (-),score=47.00 TRINITY_DN1900_c0_g1_i1:224-688(-)
MVAGTAMPPLQEGEEITYVLPISSLDIIIYTIIIMLILYIIKQLLRKKKAPSVIIPKAEEPISLNYYTKEEISKHNKRNDCWLIIDDKVYDVTSYVDNHTGGDSILNYAGDDNTKPFYGDQHPAKAFQIIDDYLIGYVKKEDINDNDSDNKKDN